MIKRIFFISVLFISTIKAQQTKTLFPEHKSQLRVPFNHVRYGVFEKAIYQSENTHTAVKPYIYNTASKSFDFTAHKSSFLKDKKSWGGRKLWNEHLIQTQGKDYWLNLDVLLDASVGKANGNIGNTIKNTRLLKLEGQIGSKLSFSAAVFETQAKFPQFITEFIKVNQPEDAAGLIPGRGKSKRFGETGHDYGISTGYISYTPNHFFNFQLGHGHNFIGDGYRSMFLSDVAAPSTYAKLTTTVGKVQYTNIWTWLRDFNFTIDNNPVNNEGHKRKYGIFHHLSWNVTNRLNLGFFEGIISDNSGTSGSLNMEYINPIIFYKNIEFANGEDSGSGAVGLNAKFKIGTNHFLYTQFLLDEFTAKEFFGSKDYWANKYALQLGAKFFSPFGIKGLTLQAEFNKVKPFTYSHEKQHNYAHFGQPLAHLWGANFWETILIARYNKNRWSANAKLVLGKKGFDIDGDATSYGGNIFVDSGNRNGNYKHQDQQGNLANILNIDAEVSYLLNPANNFRIFAGALLRNFTSDSKITRLGIVPESSGYTFNTENTKWFVLGLKADLFNHYTDY